MSLYNTAGQLTSTRAYHTIPTSGDGSAGTNYDESTFGYDTMGRQNKSTTPGGTISRTVFDARGRAVADYVGTNDSGATDADPTGGGNLDNNMVLVAEREFCDGSAGCSCGSGGVGHLVSETRWVDDSTSHTTEFQYDWRGRQLHVFPPADDAGRVVYTTTTYDNLDRAIRQEPYLEIVAGTDRLLARSDSFYDDRGRVFQTARYAVDVDTGTVGNALVSYTWFDAAGGAIKQQPAGSQAFTKTVFDSLGRAVKQYLGHDANEVAVVSGSSSSAGGGLPEPFPSPGTYADASSIADDTIVEQPETSYDDAGNVLQTTTRQRFHNAAGTGELTSPSGSQPKARVSYVCMYYDQIGRQTAMANYGTNGGTAVTRPSTVPTRSDTILVTSTEYNDAGQAYKTVDPAGREDRQVFDDLGRVVKTIQNYVDGLVSASYPDEDVTVEMACNADGNLSSLTAKNPATGNQVTRYVYGTTLADSGVATSTLKRAEIYPDSDDTPALGGGADETYDRIEFKYDRQRAVIEVKDQQETVHAFDFDALNRVSHDRVTSLGSGVDDAVRRISTTYNVRGQVELLTSYDNPTIASGNVLNQVGFEYDEHGLIIKEYQEHNGARHPNTLYVGSNYDATASAGTLTKGLRLVSLRYPNGRLIHYTYGISGGISDALKRIATIHDDDSGSPGTSLAEYVFLGQSAITQITYPEPYIRFDLAHGAGDDPHNGPLDRFSRLADLMWHDVGGSIDLVHICYGYDRTGNRLWREDLVAAGFNKDFDERYSYDQMYQLVDLQRGNLNSTKDSLVAGTETFAQEWSLDMIGNWSVYKEDDDYDGTWDVTQTRTHNAANEIAQIAGLSTHVGHDRNGNMTSVPKPNDWDTHFDLTYDAWNRLVSVENAGTVLAAYEYDARGFQTVRFTYQGEQLDETRHFYYNHRWQCLEERVNSSSNADRQFLWGFRYVDDLVFRDSNSERCYALHDANGNIVAVTDEHATVLQRFAYGAFGNSQLLTYDYGPDTSGQLGWEYRFTGRPVDAKTGLMAFRNRQYHGQLGRFLTRDPLKAHSTEGPNDYRYVRNCPTGLVDPLGTLTQAQLGCKTDCENECYDRFYPNGVFDYLSGWWQYTWCVDACGEFCQGKDYDPLCRFVTAFGDECTAEGIQCFCFLAGDVGSNIAALLGPQVGVPVAMLECFCDVLAAMQMKCDPNVPDFQKNKLYPLATATDCMATLYQGAGLSLWGISAKISLIAEVVEQVMLDMTGPAGSDPAACTKFLPCGECA